MNKIVSFSMCAFLGAVFVASCGQSGSSDIDSDQALSVGSLITTRVEYSDGTATDEYSDLLAVRDGEDLYFRSSFEIDGKVYYYFSKNTHGLVFNDCTSPDRTTEAELSKIGSLFPLVEGNTVSVTSGLGNEITYTVQGATSVTGPLGTLEVVEIEDVHLEGDDEVISRMLFSEELGYAISATTDAYMEETVAIEENSNLVTTQLREDAILFCAPVERVSTLAPDLLSVSRIRNTMNNSCITDSDAEELFDQQTINAVCACAAQKTAEQAASDDTLAVSILRALRVRDFNRSSAVSQSESYINVEADENAEAAMSLMQGNAKSCLL